MRKYDKKQSPLQAIRNTCLDCMGAEDRRMGNDGSELPVVRPYTEVRNCPNEFTCAIWPYRLGTRPARQKKEPEQLSRAA